MKHSALLKMHDYLNGRWAHQNCVRAFIPQPAALYHFEESRRLSCSRYFLSLGVAA